MAKFPTSNICLKGVPTHMLKLGYTEKLIKGNQRLKTYIGKMKMEKFKNITNIRDVILKKRKGIQAFCFKVWKATKNEEG